MSYASDARGRTSPSNITPEAAKSIALAAQADERRTANLIEFLRLPLELGGPNPTERIQARTALFASLGLSEDASEED